MSLSAHRLAEGAEWLLGSLQQSTRSVGASLQAEPETEAGYKARWMAALGNAESASGLDRLAPLAMSLQGGALAGCLSHVFIAGYQGAMRHVLPQIANDQWFSFLVSEDKQEPELNPPTQMAPSGSGVQINGTKSWVASSACVDVLVVSATTQAGATQYFWCPAQAPGVHLSHRPSPSFLPDLSQGFARFEALQVPSKQLLDARAFAHFMHAESLYVGLALVGYLWRHWQQQEDVPSALTSKQEPARSFGLGVATAIAEAVALADTADGELPLALLQAWQLRLADLLDQFETRWLGTEDAPLDTSLVASGWAKHWWRDHRLTFMYAPMIRSQFAKVTLQSLSADSRK